MAISYHPFTQFKTLLKFVWEIVKKKIIIDRDIKYFNKDL